MARRSSSTTTFTATSTFAATAPAGVTAGDYLVACLVQDRNTPVITPPSGWTSRGVTNQALPDGNHISIYTKVAAGGDSYTWTSDSTNDAIIQVYALTGRASTAPTVGTTTANTTANATPVTVTLTGLTAVDQDDVLYFNTLDLTVGADVWASTAPTSYTEFHDVSSGNFAYLSSGIREAVSAGATGNLSITATRTSGSGAAGWAGFTVAVAANTPPPTYTIAWITA